LSKERGKKYRAKNSRNSWRGKKVKYSLLMGRKRLSGVSNSGRGHRREYVRNSQGPLEKERARRSVQNSELEMTERKII